MKKDRIGKKRFYPNQTIKKKTSYNDVLLKKKKKNKKKNDRIEVFKLTSTSFPSKTLFIENKQLRRETNTCPSRKIKPLASKKRKRTTVKAELGRRSLGPRISPKLAHARMGYECKVSEPRMYVQEGVSLYIHLHVYTRRCALMLIGGLASRGVYSVIVNARALWRN